ncbi:MAG: 6-phosphogluconolactonase [Mangrovibacterium sp.]
MSTEINIFNSPEDVARAFARELSALVSNWSGDFHLALSGGSTPRMLFDVLAAEYQSKMPWKKIHFWWGDERCVPPTDPESNYKMTAAHLFSKVPVKEGQIHRIAGELGPHDAASRYSAEIMAKVKKNGHLPEFDLIMLGIGDDGHTASIFPDQMNIFLAGSICGVASHPLTGQKRVTLTLPVLNNAGRVVFLATGGAKSEPVGQIVNNGEKAVSLPARHIRPHSGKLAFFLDKQAAALIR